MTLDLNSLPHVHHSKYLYLCTSMKYIGLRYLIRFVLKFDHEIVFLIESIIFILIYCSENVYDSFFDLCK
jgi:hypothetical protein